MNEVPLSVLFLKLIPLKATSSVWGFVMDLGVPVSLRSVVYSWYAKVTGANLDEVELPLTSYQNMNAFFTRKLKSNVHSVDKSATLVSPSDGKILGFGSYSVPGNFDEEIIINHVKGFKFPLSQFIGESTRNYTEGSMNDVADLFSVISTNKAAPGDSLLSSTAKTLFYCTIYLAPSDYHRFHSPADWSLSSMRRISGELLPVFPKILNKIPMLYALNERVPLIGNWDYGHFTMTLVGSTNVGSIKIHGDEDALWRSKLVRPWTTNVEFFPHKPLQLEKGQEVGYFAMGSTIVLVFEAPERFQFCINEGQYIRMGQKLGNIGHCQ